MTSNGIVELTIESPAISALVLSRGLFHRSAMPAMVGKMKSIAIGIRLRWYLMLKILHIVRLREFQISETLPNPENSIEKTATPDAGIVSSSAFLGP